MSKAEWNKRYNSKEYIYGKEPNVFLKNSLSKLNKGRILFPAEGEGRNSVFAAKMGWQAEAFDISETGREKALKLALAMGVQINYKITSAEEASYPINTFDCLGLFFCHLPTANRNLLINNWLDWLKPGGALIFEAFAKEQINLSSGGPKNLDLLYSTQEVKHILSTCSEVNIQKHETELDEGPFHKGKAITIKALAYK